jgi:hypothetical protein
MIDRNGAHLFPGDIMNSQLDFTHATYTKAYNRPVSCCHYDCFSRCLHDVWGCHPTGLIHGLTNCWEQGCFDLYLGLLQGHCHRPGEAWKQGDRMMDESVEDDFVESALRVFEHDGESLRV